MHPKRAGQPKRRGRNSPGPLPTHFIITSVHSIVNVTMTMTVKLSTSVPTAATSAKAVSPTLRFFISEKRGGGGGGVRSRWGMILARAEKEGRFTLPPPREWAHRQTPRDHTASENPRKEAAATTSAAGASSRAAGALMRITHPQSLLPTPHQNTSLYSKRCRPNAR